MSTVQIKFVLPLALVSFALIWPTLLTCVYFVWLADGHGVATRAAFAIGKVIQFVLPLVALNLGLISWRFRALSWRTFWVGIGTTILIVIAAVVSYVLGLRSYLMTNFFQDSVAIRLAAFGITSPTRYLLLAVFYAIGHSFLEEYYWRWFIYGGLRQYLRSRWSVIASSLAFTSHHLVLLTMLWGAQSPIPYILTSAVFIGGVLWASLYERQASLWGVWISHAIIDAGIFLIGFDLI